MKPFKALLGINRRQNRSVNNCHALESLEARQLLAATLAANGTWNITGTSGNDDIYVARDDVDSMVLLVEVNGRVVDEQYATDVKSIQISGGAGNDHIEIDEVAGKIQTPTVLRGDDGNDVIIGGSGNDTIYGGRGNDRLIGNAGNDRIFGDDGDDYLAGGPGSDALDGGSGRNQIVDEPAVSSVKNRVPAEWERHDSTWMQWPKGEEKSYRDNFAGIIIALQRTEQVNLAVESQAAKTEAMQFLTQRGVPLSNVQFHIMPYDWSWMRDNGAIWVEQTDAKGVKKMAVQDWGFDGWGGDGGPSRKDDAVPQHVARIEGVGYEKISVVLEKGTLEFNGKDTVIASWTVLNNRNPQMTRDQLDVVLKSKFGVSKVVWIEGASADDITDGHVDGIARFVNENTVVVGRLSNQNDPDAQLYEKAAGLNVVRMEIPGYVRYKGESLQANYLNFLVANGVVVGSSYGNATFDNAARLRLQQLFPGREIVLTDTRELWLNGGAVHCVTNDQPFLTASPTPAQSGGIPSSNPASVSLTDTLATLATAVDQQFGLTTTGKLFENWGGRGEKWISGNDGWYFLTPDGGLYHWNRTPKRAEGTLVAQLDASFHREPATIYNATELATARSEMLSLDKLFSQTFDMMLT
jgi:agmatine deiminase